ncbi:MAG: hypothetical protein COV48_08435 [Elusimicrobia bacterium CG11_big_fil_rev_8_21_14_0_20_64_6]|nr:MAG: hypothetical protein COV48_08435 [Elusimicrobia bacterium CG11_big_fil_rev_8_21_14_0_20_64_6]
MQRETTVVKLRITSATLTAQAIEAKLGLKPDEAWKIGDRTGTFGAILKDHGYELISSALYTLDLADHLRVLLKRIAPVAQKVGEISSEAKVEIVCTLFVKSTPPISFTRDDLRWFAAMGASLDVEVGQIVERVQPTAKKPGDKEGPASVF